MKRDQVGKSSTPLTSKQSYDIISSACFGAIALYDTPEAVQVRLQTYREQTDPILELFRKKELVVTVDAAEPANVVQAEIRAQLGLDA